jgi:hypothetical protein
MRNRTLAALTVVSVSLLALVTTGAASASTRPAAIHTRSEQVSRHKVLSINPTCFVAGHRSWAHITLNHVGPSDRVEFIWARPGVLSLGPGLGPGVYRAGASGIVRFAALSPARFGSAQVGQWVLVAEWPRAPHPFTKTFFRIVRSQSACSS